MSKDILEYKGYYTKIFYSAQDQVLYGKIEGINDLVNFESKNATEIEKEFHKAVDDYLALCEDLGVDPDKSYSGTFNVRLDPELHKKIATEAFLTNKSLNQVVAMAISLYFRKESIHIENVNFSFITKERQQSITNKNMEMWENVENKKFFKPHLLKAN